MPEEKKEQEILHKKMTSKIVESPEELIAREQHFKFPGKVLCIEKQADLDHNLIVIADSGNNRLVIINEDTMKFECQIGNGKMGLVDGSYTEVQFHHPLGLCHVFREQQHFIYVCDTKNHAIREVNLSR